MEHTKNILNKFGRVMDGERKPAELRRLPFGDLEVQTTSLENKRWAENHSDWTKAIAAFAGIIKRSYGVLAHGVRMTDINTINQIEPSKTYWHRMSGFMKGPK